MHQFIEIERLGKILERVAVAGADCRIQRILSRQNDHGHVGGGAPDRVDRRQAIAILQHYICQHDIEPTMAEQHIAPFDALAGGNLEPVLAQRLGNDRGDALVVFDQQNCVAHRSPTLPLSAD